MPSGIYLLTFTAVAGRPAYYVGQSMDLRLRAYSHERAARKGEHHNWKVQRAYRACGAAAFAVLELCPADELVEREQWWLDWMHGHEGCLNIASDAELSMRGVKHSPEHVRKRAAAISGDQHYLSGKPMPADHRAAISAGGRGVKKPASAIAKYAAAATGKKNGMFGRTGAASPRGRAVVGMHIQTLQVVRFESANLARSAGFLPEQITRCCHGVCRKHRGYVWAHDDSDPEHRALHCLLERAFSKRFQFSRNASGQIESWLRLSDPT